MRNNSAQPNLFKKEKVKSIGISQGEADMEFERSIGLIALLGVRLKTPHYRWSPLLST